ncbi:hypothetical protein GUJ93_ZPchr0011g28234 [Zizania palustris]|uniref:Uncharacterized protein n=1 Tax=Zizania palustris TaxID=103762 RepID=A0A8J5WFR9_ZIZPA|nr:hypothetical protein GUJ93_ZPchr0011g28234 [Zizania palustris]
MGSGDDMKELIEKLAAKIDDLKTSLDKLAPLAPVAEQLATLPSKVVALQSSAFENQEQVRALNLAILRAENAQREGRAHAEDNGDTTGEGSINQSRQGPVPPPENDRPPPRDRFRQLPPEQGRGHYDEEEDALDNRFHPRVATPEEPIDARCQWLEMDCISDKQQLEQSKARCTALEDERDLAEEENSSLLEELAKSMQEADHPVVEKEEILKELDMEKSKMEELKQESCKKADLM